jgi:hypothetical protein
MTNRQTRFIEKAANDSGDDPKKFFQILGRLPRSTWRGVVAHVERGFKAGKKTNSWFSERILFKVT